MTTEQSTRPEAGTLGAYLKKHTEALIKDVGFERACSVTGKSKATLGRYFSALDEHSDRFMPVDVVAQLEAAASFPHVTNALAELRMITLEYDSTHKLRDGRVNEDVVLLSQRFARLMEEYHVSMNDHTISLNEAKRMIAEAQRLQKVLMEMKLHLERESRL